MTGLDWPGALELRHPLNQSVCVIWVRRATGEEIRLGMGYLRIEDVPGPHPDRPCGTRTEIDPHPPAPRRAFRLAAILSLAKMSLVFHQELADDSTAPVPST